MMFEVQDLAVASPATVSRCGMVYLEPSILGLMPFVECWLKHLPSIIKPYEEQFKTLFVKFLEVGEVVGMPKPDRWQKTVTTGHTSLVLVPNRAPSPLFEPQ